MPRSSFFYKSINIFIIFGCLILLLVSCSLTPEKLSKEQRLDDVSQALDKLYTKEENKNLAINLRQALSLALENNLQYRLDKLQTALSYKQYDLAKMDLYPNANSKFNYDHRNKNYVKTLTNTTGGTSGTQALIPNTIKSGDITFNWDVLNFGVSYVLAKQAGDRYRLAQEQRKQMAAKLINDVIRNYMLAYYGQELNSKIADVEQEVNAIVSNLDLAIESRIGDINKQLNYKKSLTEEYREIKDQVVLFNQARDELLNLINFNSKDNLNSAQIVLLPPEKYLTELPAIENSLLDIDTVALYNRPELTQELYKIKEAERQTTLVVLEKLPSLGINLGYNYDSDKFLKHQNWWRDNISIAWNLVNLASIPAERDVAKTQLEKERLTYLASAAVVISEIRAVLYNYKMKKYDYKLAEEQSKYSDQIYQHRLNLISANLSDEQSLALDKLLLISAELSKLRTFVDARNLLEDLILAIGLYHTSGELIKKDYIDLEIVFDWLNKFNNNKLEDIITQEYASLTTLPKKPHH